MSRILGSMKVLIMIPLRGSAPLRATFPKHQRIEAKAFL